jgi:hypothetical protein
MFVMILEARDASTARLSAAVMEWGRAPVMDSTTPASASASASGTGLAITKAARPKAMTAENLMLKIEEVLVKESEVGLKNGRYQAQLENVGVLKKRKKVVPST